MYKVMATLSFIMYVYGKNKNKNEIKKNTQINERKHKQICGKEGGVGWTTFCELNQWINASLHVCQPEFMSVRGIMYTRNILKKDLWKASLDDDKPRKLMFVSVRGKRIIKASLPNGIISGNKTLHQLHPDLMLLLIIERIQQIWLGNILCNK